MKKLKGILSIFMVLALICSTFAFAMSAQAADTAKGKTGLDPNLQDDVSKGVILHALCWGYSEIEKNIPAIAAAGYSAVQVSPVQQPKDMNTSTNVSGQWWKMYQPVSLSLAQDSWVGTPEQLKSLCTTAHKYNVKVICDVVTNHLGATSDKSYESSPWYKLADEVKTFEKTLWNSTGMTKNNPYFHNPELGRASDSNVTTVTQHASSDCPDLNSGNSTVQNRVTSLLKECIDAGADGFRFDAAKHIETPKDSISPNNYWTNVISGANSYAQTKGKSNIFYYGEVLNSPGGGRDISGYTNLNSGKYRVTDNQASASVRGGVTGKNASTAASLNCSKAGGNGKAVVWAESHDTFLNTKGELTSSISNADIVKTWALIAAHKDATPLFFARTTGMKMGGAAIDTTYKSTAVTEVNKFHNNFASESEKSGASGSIAYVARGTKGVVLVNTNGTSANASVSGTGLANGEYKDMVTGNKFTVSGGTVSGNIGSTGVAVVAQSDTTPAVYADQESQTFKGDTITVGLTLSNATSGTYQLEDYAPVTFTGSPKIRLGSDYNKGETIKLTLTATDGKKTTSTVYYYTKSAAQGSGVYIMIPASTVSTAKWNAPLYCYLFDQDSGNGLTVGGQVYKNASWPGEEMEYDSKLDVYYIEVSNNSCISEKTTKVSGGQVTGSAEPVASNFNLAASTKTHVIFSDSAKESGGTSQGNQYPGSSSKKTLDLGGKSHKLTSLSATVGDSKYWVVTTEVPGVSTTPVAATEVKKGNATQPTTQPETQAQQPTTPITGDMIYGDVNGDKAVSIKDATLIQKHSALIEMIAESRKVLGDVNSDKSINVKDATAVQKYLAQLNGYYNVGKPYDGGNNANPTEAPSAPQTEPEDDPEPPEPSGVYTVYLKTTLSWFSSMGAEPYVYDKASGESYLMVKDESAYPEVFTADVPLSVSDVTIYRATSALSDPSEGYNQINCTFSEKNNCYRLNDYPDGGSPDGAVEPYVAEEQPDALTTLYVKNDKNWSNVYIYGWGYGMANDTLPLEKVSGNIWKIDLPQPIPDGIKTFLLKDTEGADSWVNKTNDITVDMPNNCFVLSTGKWEKYNG